MKRISIIFSFIGIFFLSGCEKYLDVNKDPNYPTDVEDYLSLPAAQVSVASVFSAEYSIVGSFWSQHWAQNNTSSQYKTFETYTLSSNDGFVDNSYFELYSGGLSDNEIIHRKAREEKNWGLYLMTSTLKAFTFQYLVDLYDNVPYTEAFKAEEGILNPAINTGQEIYDSIYYLLNEALSKDFAEFNIERYRNYDLLLGAEIEEWQAFANTLKLRILLRQYNVRTDFARTEIDSLLSRETAFLSSDVALTNFLDEDSKSNPLYETDQRQLNTKNNIRANATFVSYLKANKDPRMSLLFNKVGGDIIGMVTGSYEVPSTEFVATDIIANPKFTATMPVYFMTVAESELLQAEAYLRLGKVEEAKEHYDAGVESSFERMEADMGTLIDEGGAYFFPSSNFGAQLEAIIMQKWVDAADGQRGIESFIEQVRTGIPKLSAVNASISVGVLPSNLSTIGYIPGTLIYSKKGSTGGRFPVRLPYPDSELNFNSNAAVYKDLSDADVMQTKVWWNK